MHSHCLILIIHSENDKTCNIDHIVSVEIPDREVILRQWATITEQHTDWSADLSHTYITKGSNKMILHLAI